MDNLLTTLKVGLAAHLQKQGSSLEEFEASLASVDQAKGAVKVATLLTGISKQAYFGEDTLGHLGKGIVDLGMGFAKAAPEIAATSALVVGTGLGAGAYGIKKHMDNQDDDLKSKQEEVHRVKSLTERLKADYGIKNNK